MHRRFEDYLNEERLQLLECEPNGYCLVNSWLQALFLQGESWSFEELLNVAVNELKSFPAIYGLTENAHEELDSYMQNANYMCDAVDCLPKALVNITRYTAVLHIIDSAANITKHTISPDFGDDEGVINIAYSAYKLHYDTIIHIPGSYICKFIELVILMTKFNVHIIIKCPHNFSNFIHFYMTTKYIFSGMHYL